MSVGVLEDSWCSVVLYVQLVFWSVTVGICKVCQLEDWGTEAADQRCSGKEALKQKFLCKRQKTGSDTQASFINRAIKCKAKPAEKLFIYFYLALNFY